jgi:hypothetical protein
MQRVFIKFFILVSVAVCSPISLFAQNLSVTKIPPYPKAGESVVLSVSSFVANLEKSLITWKENNEVVLEGIGKTNYTIPSARNTTFTVEVVDSATKKKFTQGITITTSEIDLLWEAIGSYTPPFYKGKALPALEANINVVAIPKNQLTQNLFYSWEKEYQKQSSQSGKGKNSFGYIATPLEQANDIAVTVSSSDGSFSSQENVVIRYGNSEVLFYQDDPGLGTLFNKAIKNGFNIGTEKDIILTAIPYFITADTATSKVLDMIWSVNGATMPEQTVKNKVRLIGQCGLSGNAVVSIFIKNTSRLFEEGSVGISLEF